MKMLQRQTVIQMECGEVFYLKLKVKNGLDEGDEYGSAEGLGS